MLPLHGGGSRGRLTSHWAGATFNTFKAEGYVFGKQLRFLVAEFLL